MDTSKENRIFYYDNLKFFLILAVVVGHFIDEISPLPNSFKSLFLWIYSFHMPLFIFISGMFHKNERITPKVTKLVMIGFAIPISLLLVNLILGQSAGTISFFRSSALPWFVFVLAGYTVLSYLLRNMDQRSILIFSIIIGLFSGYDPSLEDTLFASRFFVFYPFFVLGNMVSPNRPLKALEKRWVRALGILILALWAVICRFKLDSVYILRALFTGRNPFRDTFGQWAFLYRGLTYLITVLAGFGVMCLIPKKRIPVVTRFGGRTIQIYFWHYHFLKVFLLFGVGALFCADAFGKLTWLMIAVACTFVTGLKVFGFPTTQISRLSRYANNQTKGAL